MLWSSVGAALGIAAQAGGSNDSANGGASASGRAPASQQIPAPPESPSIPSRSQTAGSTIASSAYEGKVVQSIQIAGVRKAIASTFCNCCHRKSGEPLDRGRFRDSIRALYATGRFSDIQAEATPSGSGSPSASLPRLIFLWARSTLTGPLPRPTPNQIVNASKFQLGELYTHEKLDRAIENIRQLMQEGGYYRRAGHGRKHVESGHAAGEYSVPYYPRRTGTRGRGESHRARPTSRRSKYRRSRT